MSKATNSLVENGIPADPKKMSGLVGSHHYRNKVIHKGIQPTSDEDLKAISDETVYIDYLIRTLVAKKTLENERP